MASHRALIVAASSADQLANLRDRPPLLIAADSGLHAVLDRGWTPDLVIGDLDSATAAAVETARSAGAAVETADIGKDETDLELALAAAITRGATDLRIVVRSDGRLDHQLANLAVLAALLERVDLLTPLAKQRRQQLDHGARRVRQRLRRAARRRAPGMDVSWTRHSCGEGRLRRVGSTRRTCTPRPAGRGNMRAERGTASRAPR